MEFFEFDGLRVFRGVNLAKMTTMRLGGDARFFTRIKNVEEAVGAVKFARVEDLPIYILGGGSNTLVRDAGFSGLVIKNEILGREVIFDDGKVTNFRLGAGENWDEFVRWAVKSGYQGCEAMVMIPGTVGALPVQNVGAYGQEIADVMVALRALNLRTLQIETLSREDCGFSYRDSIFRGSASGKYLILSVDLMLKKSKIAAKPFYVGVEKYLTENGVDLERATAEEVMNSVIAIRSQKLPDPKEIASAGSFFKNAIISKEKAERLRAEFGDEVPLFAFGDKFKVATGWLIDKAGLRGKEFYGMRTHPQNALVLTNISAKGFDDLVRAREEIKAAVWQKFEIEIEQEPLEI